MNRDIFTECRERVSARSVAERYGFEPRQDGFICCPFHDDKTPSLKLYDNGSFHCFGCGVGGSSIDFMARLEHLTPLEAVRRLSDVFQLGLTSERQQRPSEWLKTRETWERFEAWREGTISQLEAVWKMGRNAIPHEPDGTAEEAEAIRWMATADYIADILKFGTMVEKMQIFRERKEVEARCKRILNRSPRR